MTERMTFGYKTCRLTPSLAVTGSLIWLRN